MGDALSADPPQSLSPPVTRNDAQLHFRLPEFRRSARQPNRASQRQFTPAAEREPVHRGNGWLAQRFELMQDGLSMQGSLRSRGWRQACEFVDVGSRDKGLITRARQN